MLLVCYPYRIGRIRHRRYIHVEDDVDDDHHIDQHQPRRRKTVGKLKSKVSSHGKQLFPACCRSLPSRFGLRWQFGYVVYPDDPKLSLSGTNGIHLTKFSSFLVTSGTGNASRKARSALVSRSRRGMRRWGQSKYIRSGHELVVGMSNLSLVQRMTAACQWLTNGVCFVDERRN